LGSNCTSRPAGARYYLVHDGAEVPGDKTVSEVTGHADAVHLKLRTELIRGAS
jgi:hypothetical protein